MKHSMNWPRILLLSALALVLVVPWSVLADNVVVDGDILTGVQTYLNLGEVCLGQGETGEATVFVTRNGQGSGQNVFANSATVTISKSAGSSALSVGEVTINLPSNWVDQGNNSQSEHKTATVILSDAGGLGSHSETITLSAVGPEATGGDNVATRTATLTVNWTTVSCTPSDTTPPTTTIMLSPEGPDGLDDWYVSDVHVTVSATDNVGVVETRCVLDPTTVPTEFDDLPTTACAYGGTGADVSADGEHVVWAGSIDAAGNWDLVSAPFQIDQTDPALNTDGAESGDYVACSIPERPTFDPQDATSGLHDSGDSWQTPSTASGVGTYTYHAWATDNAGNDVDETRTYNVTYGAAFTGFQAPVVIAGGGRGHFKLGSTIPVKFALSCDGTPIDDAVAWLYVRQSDKTVDYGTYEVASTSAATTGNLFRYDPVGQQYIFNLSTKTGYQNPTGTWVSFSAGTWLVEIKLDDGTYRSTTFDLK